jgi:hypothetical protein
MPPASVHCNTPVDAASDQSNVSLADTNSSIACVSNAAIYPTDEYFKNTYQLYLAAAEETHNPWFLMEMKKMKETLKLDPKDHPPPSFPGLLCFLGAKRDFGDEEAVRVIAELFTLGFEAAKVGGHITRERVKLLRVAFAKDEDLIIPARLLNLFLSFGCLRLARLPEDGVTYEAVAAIATETFHDVKAFAPEPPRKSSTDDAKLIELLIDGMDNMQELLEIMCSTA